MELFDNLASVGLTTGVLQIIIVAGAVLLIAGMFWKYLLAGLGIAFCVAVFAMPSKKVDTKPVETMTNSAPSMVQPETKPDTQSLKPNEEIVEVIPEDTSEKGMFMTDCQKYGGYTASQCVALWNDRENDKVSYRRATNKMFMMKAKHNYRYDRT
jgi:cell division protein FtsW (lipid II flippase)